MSNTNQALAKRDALIAWDEDAVRKNHIDANMALPLERENVDQEFARYVSKAARQFANEAGRLADEVCMHLNHIVRAEYIGKCTTWKDRAGNRDEANGHARCAAKMAGVAEMAYADFDAHEATRCAESARMQLMIVRRIHETFKVYAGGYPQSTKV